MKKIQVILVGNSAECIAYKQAAGRLAGFDAEYTIVPFSPSSTPEVPAPVPAPVADPLNVEVVFDMAAGTVTFQPKGGDDSEILYMAPGVTPWTTKRGPHKVDPWVLRDSKDLTIYTEQSKNRQKFKADIPARPAPAPTPVEEPQPQPEPVTESRPETPTPIVTADSIIMPVSVSPSEDSEIIETGIITTDENTI